MLVGLTRNGEAGIKIIQQFDSIVRGTRIGHTDSVSNREGRQDRSANNLRFILNH